MDDDIVAINFFTVIRTIIVAVAIASDIAATIHVVIDRFRLARSYSNINYQVPWSLYLGPEQKCKCAHPYVQSGGASCV